MNTRCTVIAALLALTSATLQAQEPQQPLVTRTIALRYLAPVDAARLVSPYVRSPQGGVYEASAVRAITVTETAPIIARIDSIVRDNDRSQPVLALRFQLISADDSPAVDPAVEPAAASLRRMFSYKGYHLLGEGSTTASEGEGFGLTIAGGEDRFALTGEVAVVQGGENGATRIRIRLSRASGATYEGKRLESEMLLSTGLTVPLGQTVVLGSAAPGGANKALILAVRPEVAIPPRR